LNRITPDPIYLATAVEAALAAGRIQRRYFRQPLTVEKKGPIDLVTAADLEVEREFRALIANRFPTHTVLGEEQGSGPASREPRSGEARFRWIVDPIDGTTNFAHGLALFCTSIALEIDGQLAVGVVYDPMAEELFTAERGGGARLNGAPLRVSDADRLLNALLCTGFPYSIREERERLVAVFSAFLGEGQGIRRLGSAALDLCYVAAGRLDAFWEVHLHPWDMAAGVLIVEEAGGRVTDYTNRPVDLFGGQCVASNGRIHDAMLEVIVRAAGAAGR
jgi:myo-inositol-1(or 4)-monophosphatase